MTRLDFIAEKQLFFLEQMSIFLQFIFEKQLGIHGLSFHTQTFFSEQILRFENVFSDSVLVAGIQKYFLTNFIKFGYLKRFIFQYPSGSSKSSSSTGSFL